MKFNSFLVKYGEIGLKGKNRYKFEDALVFNIKKTISPYLSDFNVYKEQERIYIDINSDFDYNLLIEKLKNIFGIYSISPVLKIPYTDDFKKLENSIIDYVKNIYGDKHFTFKVKTRRVNKKFPVNSDEINMELGHSILVNFENTKVDVHNPDIYFYIEIRNHINIYSENIEGAKGLPVGTSDKGVLLLSGGIDSPVAGYMISKRGVKLEAVYFHSPPYTSDRAKDKVIKLSKILSQYTGSIKLHIINFTDIQLNIYEKCPHDELTIIMRRMMMRIAERVAHSVNALSLITGESIGQVASQTTSAIYTTNACVNIPVFRPLIGFDKEEIIKIAEKIGTFETSILPYEDCCTIFVAKHPVTNPKLEKILQSEKALVSADEMIENAINKEEVVICNYET